MTSKIKVKGASPQRWLTKIDGLEKRTRAEGLRLAREVVDNRMTRAQLHTAVEETGDAEPIIALEYLDMLEKILIKGGG